MSVVRVDFKEALGNDQGEKDQGEERLGDSFSGGGFHSFSGLRAWQTRANCCA